MNHPKCNKVRADREWFPTRLIDVGRPGPGDEVIRLIATSNSLPDGPYVTLSHCWGSAIFLQLTRATFNDLQQGISMSRLTQTFQDAILLTQRLRVRYLWIDSLCIMQDRDDLCDWLHEAALMHKVYSNSLLNIAATGATDSSKGLFAQRDPQNLIPAEVDLCLHGLQQSAVSIKYQLTDILFWQKELSEAPLNRRAWVVQERLLAPRVLHFGRYQLMRECCEMDAAEIYPVRLPPALSAGALTRSKGLDPLDDGAKLRQRGPHDRNPRFFAHQLWHRIVKAYSRGLLTKPEDKLVALSGIAKRISQIVEDEYVAGMWRFCLESQLLWYVQDCKQINHEPSAHASVYRAPSFSWASVDGNISGGQLTDEGMLIDVVEINIEHETNDVTGLIKSGFLRLKGTLKLLKLAWDMFTETWVMTVNGTDLLPRMETERERLGPLVFLDVNQPDFNELNERDALFCMPARAPMEQWTLLVCLIFEKVEGQNGTFRRLGISMTGNKELVNMLLTTHENEASLPCEQYGEDSRRHTIRVI
jgi:Heterokaryon incompatibility protein (HET)